jgi:Fe-S cluster biogenesis protein NfuA/nitrite reductase/ring-hydroxylating ferredoxin subunit
VTFDSHWEARNLRTNGQGNGESNPIGPGEDINAQGERIQLLLERIQALPYPAAREIIQECMEAVLAFYGQGLNRILKIVQTAGPERKNVYRDLIGDDIVRGLLLIHDLHPLDLETRLRDALDRVRPYLRSHGGNVELVSLESGRARLRLQGTCESCPSSAITLELAIRQAIEQACPDLIHFDVEGVTSNSAPKSAQGVKRTGADWEAIEEVAQLAEGDWLPVRVGRTRVVVCRVNQTLYAYRNRCPACNLPFDAGSLDQGFLSCSLGHRYDIVRAGRRVDVPGAYLEPFPLLVEEGVVKIALNRDGLDATTEAASRTF